MTADAVSPGTSRSRKTSGKCACNSRSSPGCASPAGASLVDRTPAPAVAFDERIGPRRSPATRRVGLHVIGALVPPAQDVLGPDPRLLHFVGACKQGPVADHPVQQQARVRIGLLDG